MWSWRKYIFLAKENPGSVVVGIDKSVSRISRKNLFKENQLQNVKIVRGELLDLIYLIYQSKSANEINIQEIYIYYPNPYPKKIHVKRRFHGNPIVPFIFGLDVSIYMRSNWKLYLEEFLFVSKLYNRNNSENSLKKVDISIPITPFERKFIDSQQDIFELVIF